MTRTIALVLTAALLVGNAVAQDPSPMPTVTPRSIRVSFVPPPLDGTISLGVYDAKGKPADYWDRSATQRILINPQPPYNQDWNGWGPRLAVDYELSSRTVLHAGGSIATRLQNLWQENFLTAGIPYCSASI